MLTAVEEDHSDHDRRAKEQRHGQLLASALARRGCQAPQPRLASATAVACACLSAQGSEPELGLSLLRVGAASLARAPAALAQGAPAMAVVAPHLLLCG